MTLSNSRRIVAAACAALLAAVVGGAMAGAQEQKAPPPPPALTGKWVLSLELPMGTSNPTLELAQDGDKLKGTYAGRYGKFALTGTVKARAVQFTVVIDADGQESEMRFVGEIAADGVTMKGEAHLEGMGDATWSAKRAPKTAADSPASPR